MNKKIWLFAMILLSQVVQARYLAVKKEDQFVDEINKYEFVVACFLPNLHEQEHADDKQLRKDIKQLQETVKATAETEPYKKALKNDVAFIFVDTTREDLQLLLEKYKISGDALPQFLLFKHGKSLTAVSGNLATLQGCVAKSDLLEFINDYFGHDFDEILAKRAEQDAQDREMQLARYQAYAAARYPYGGYAPYNPWGSPGPYIYSGYAQFFPYGYGYNGYAFFIP